MSVMRHQQIFDELTSLNELDERQELEKAKRALEERERQKDLRMREVDHRVKNSLQILSSLLYLQAKTAGPAASQLNNAAARVAAIAAIHEQLHKHDDIGTVVLDRYIIDLCRRIAVASSSSDRAWTLVVDADPLTVLSDVAVPLALIVNELVMNAIQHSRPQGEGGYVHIVLKSRENYFSICISDPGDGPSADYSTSRLGIRHAGLGTRIVEALVRQINATLEKEYLAPGYKVTVVVPYSQRRAPRASGLCQEVNGQVQASSDRRLIGHDLSQEMPYAFAQALTDAEAEG
jgi:two-component sensor histidine kinase